MAFYTGRRTFAYYFHVAWKDNINLNKIKSVTVICVLTRRPCYLFGYHDNDSENQQIDAILVFKNNEAKKTQQLSDN